MLGFDSQKIRVHHILAHLGGGVGRSISSILSFEAQNNTRHVHSVLLVDKPEKMQFVEKLLASNIRVDTLDDDNYDSCIEDIKIADIVVIHWWHHPILAEFLAVLSRCQVRFVLWAHVNGCNFPCIPFKLIDQSIKTFFTTPYSYENPFWSKMEHRLVRQKADVIYGLGDERSYYSCAIKDNDVFTVGYVGTLADSKIHPRFIDFCHSVIKKIPKIRFLMVGEYSNKLTIVKEINERNLECYFSFVGYTSNVQVEMEKMNIFGYPLNPSHFGATENVLIEAMSHGLPIIALNQNTEKHILGLSDEKIAFLVNTPSEYSSVIKYLHDNPDEIHKIGTLSKVYVEKYFSFERNVLKMRHHFDSLIANKKRKINFKEIFGVEPHDWFLSVLGADYKLFSLNLKAFKLNKTKELMATEAQIRHCSPILRGDTKSSILHFSQYFPKDRVLSYWKGLVIDHHAKG